MVEPEQLLGRDVVMIARQAMLDTAQRRGVDDDTLYLLALDAAFALRTLFAVDPWALSAGD